MVTATQVWDVLKGVNDPEYPLSVVDLGMIYNVTVEGGRVGIDITFTAMGCPAIDMILSDVEEAVKKLPGVTQLSVEVVWSPPWTKDKITREGRQILLYHGVGV